MRWVWTYSPSCSAPCTVGAISRHVSQKGRPLAHAMDQPAPLSRQVRSSPVACRVLSSHNRFRNICWGAAKSLNMALAESALHPRPPKYLQPPPDAGAGTSASLPTPTSWGLWLRRQIFHGKCASLQTYLKCLHPPPPPSPPFLTSSAPSVHIRSKQRTRSSHRSCRLLWRALCLLLNEASSIMPVPTCGAVFD